MKIAILGAQGFIGRNLTNYLGRTYSVIPITRNVLDLLNPVDVKQYLKENSFDIVINCAAVMTDDSSLHDARNNLGMFMNFYNNKNFFGKFINTASGAEFDRTTNIDNALEEDIFNKMPKDSYGWGQNIKARLCAQTDNFYNIRIFNCFGSDEQSTRIFPRFLKQGYLEISNDRYFDYFSIEDLKKVTTHCIENTWNVKDVNAVYKLKYKISEVVKQFCDLNNLDSNFVVLSESSNNYTGCGDALETLDVKLEGLQKGLSNYILKD